MTVRRPPSLAERLLLWFLPPGVRGRSMAGDLHEQYAARDTRRSSQWWYVVQAARLAARYAPQTLMQRIARRRTGMLLDDIGQDVRYGVRSLVRQPLFTLTAVGTLALGIGATTFVFSAVNATLLRPLPVAEPARLVVIDESRRGPNAVEMVGHTAFTYERYLGYRDAVAGALSGLAGHRIEQFALRADGESKLLTGAVVTGSYFEVLGVRPALGRFFTAAMDSAGGESPVVVLGHGLWQREFGGDPDVIGRTVYVDSRPLTVIGVAPREFGGTIVNLMLDVWVPAATYRLPPAAAVAEAAPRTFWLNFFGRLAPGVTMARAEALLDVSGRRVPTEHPDTEVLDVRLEPLTGVPVYRSAVIGFMSLLLATAGLMLLIVAANLAGMLLARAMARRREIGIRLAVGAGRGRIMRQLLVESVLLFSLGGAAGVLLAHWLTRIVAALRLPVPVDISLDYPVDERVLGFALIVALVTGVAFGLAPAARATRVALIDALRHGGGAGVRGTRLRNVFVIGQFAASLVLLVTAVVFVRSLQKGLAVDPGFETAGLVRGEIGLSAHGYDRSRGQQFFERLDEALAARPEIEGMTRAMFEPLSSNNNNIGMQLPAWRADGRDGFSAAFGVVDPAYFALMRTRLVGGRGFTPADVASGNVAVINQTLARRLFESEDPIGRVVLVGGVETRVVGVTADGKYRSLREPPRPYAFLPFATRFGSATTAVVYVRARAGEAGEAAALRALREEVAALDPDVVVERPGTASDQIGFLLIPQRMAAAVIAGFGMAGLLLAAMGIYGVLSYYVVQRTREFGVRLALGGTRRAVVTPVVVHGLRMALIGLAIGALLAAAVLRFAASFLYGIDPADLPALAGTVLLLAAVALLASWLPARRAARVDPLVALRSE